jgi:hypothetical protein
MHPYPQKNQKQNPADSDANFATGNFKRKNRNLI